MLIIISKKHTLVNGFIGWNIFQNNDLFGDLEKKGRKGFDVFDFEQNLIFLFLDKSCGYGFRISFTQSALRTQSIYNQEFTQSLRT